MLLAHELTHALRGCEGNSFYAGRKVDYTQDDGAVVEDGIDPWEDIDGKKSDYHSREEYDVINEWENKIHREIAGPNAPQREGHR